MIRHPLIFLFPFLGLLLLVQRIFIPGNSPAAITVALPESDLISRFDAALCWLR